jgi:hypothetical protein
MPDQIKIMSVPTFVQYTSDGARSTYSFPFCVFAAANVEVFVNKDKADGQYTVSGVGQSDGGSITFTQPPAAGKTITIRRRLPIERTNDFQESSELRAAALNHDLDYLTACVQQLEDDVGRCVALSATDPLRSLAIPDLGERRDKLLGFDDEGNLVAVAAGNGGAAGGWRNLDDIPEGSVSHHFTSENRAKLEQIPADAAPNPPPITTAEKTSGTEAQLRSLSPRDVRDMVQTHAPGAVVPSVFGRTGAIVAQNGDYNAEQITDTANKVVMTATERTKLAGIQAGAQVNPTSVSGSEKAAGTQTALRSFSPADVRDMVQTHSPGAVVPSVFGRTGAIVAQNGDYNAEQITDTANKVVMTATERTKLAGIQAGAQVNPTSVSGSEKAAGTQTALRSFSPADVREMAQTFASDVGAAPRIATLAALKALNPAGNSLVWLQGKTAAGDDGAGLFDWVASFDPKQVTAATVNAGGAGYQVGDILYVGDHWPATLRVSSVSSGAVTGVTIVRGGVLLASPGTTNVATRSLRSLASGCTLNLTIGNVDNDETCVRTTADTTGRYVRRLFNGAVVSNLAALLAVAPAAADVAVRVLGYDTPGDGGGGLFRWQAGFAPKQVVSATVQAGGVNYAVGDVLSLDDSSEGRRCVFRVTATSGGGETGPATAVAIVNGGLYTTAPVTSACPTTSNHKNTDPDATGLTLNLTLGEATDFGTVFVAPRDLTGRWVRQYDRTLSIKAFGAKGDGVADDSAAIQYATWSGIPIDWPAGTYNVHLPIRFSHLVPVVWQGVSSFRQAGNKAVAFVVDKRAEDVEEPLIHHEIGWPTLAGPYYNAGRAATGFKTYALLGDRFIIRNMDFVLRANHTLTQGITLQSVRGAVIEDVTVENAGLCGVDLGDACFDSTLTNVRVNGSAAWYFSTDRKLQNDANVVAARRRAGIRVSGHTALYYCRAAGCGVGLDINGPGIAVLSGRFETNVHGMCIGQGYWSASSTSFIGGSADGVSIEGVSFEYNYCGMYIAAMRASRITACRMQGSLDTTSQDWNSVVGLYITKPSAVDTSSVIDNLNIGGYFDQAPVINLSRVAISRLITTNSKTGSAATGTTGVTLGTSGSHAYSLPHTTVIHNNEFPKAVKAAHRGLTLFNDLVVRGLTGFRVRPLQTSGDAQGGIPFARNFAGFVTPSNGAVYADVTFRPAYAMSTYALAAPTTAAHANAVPAGDYWFARTIVFDDAETGINYSDDNAHAYRKVSVPSGHRVTLTLNTSPPPGAVNRIYFGRRKGWFEGYWEGMASGTWIYDSTTPAPMALQSYPPGTEGAGADIPSRAEIDTNYGILAVPSWPTTVWVTNRATTGFRLNFGSPAPDGSQSVTWLLVRP